MSELRKELLKKLVKIQNSDKYINQDIMTFTGFLSDEELTEYVTQKEKTN